MTEKRALTEEKDEETLEAWKRQAKEVCTLEQLVSFIRSLDENYHHDYGTQVHASAAAMMAAFWCFDRISARGGMTGFQASCVGWMIAKELLSFEGPARLQKFEDLLFPQYSEKFEKVISADSWAWLQKRAGELLAEHPGDEVHNDVRRHWRSITAGEIPFGFRVGDPG